MNTTRQGRAAIAWSTALIFLAAGVGTAHGSGDRDTKTTFQAADVVEFFGPDPDPSALVFRGAAWLLRSNDTVKGRIMSQVAHPGLAYTVWWVVFNNPSACVDGCNGPDLGNPDVRGAVYFGGSAISSSDGAGGGVVNISLETNSRGIPDGVFRLDDVLPEPVFYDRGLDPNNGLNAEIHLVIDEHTAPAKDGSESWVADLMTTDFPGIPVLGAFNHRAAVFPPVRTRP